MLRQIMLALMLVVLLPWNAYAAAFAAQGHTVVQVGDHHANADMAKPMLALAPRKCRTAVLPGFTCPGDPAILAQTPTDLGDPAKVALYVAGDWAAASAIGEPPTGPPRSA